jgi:hypothetical protein
LIREHHAHAGHVGGERLWNEMAKFFHFSPIVGAKELTLKISKECEICQTHSPPRFCLKGLLRPTIISTFLRPSVSMDLFDGPKTKLEGQKYGRMAVCVDRLSGWTVVTPHKRKGLTAKVVAKEIFSRWLEPFGLPTVRTKIRKRVGQDLYEIKVKPEIFQNVHTQLKFHLEDHFFGKPLPQNFEQGEAEDLEATPGKHAVKKILSHRKGPNGQWQFLVKWKGWDESDSTWEPIEHFFQWYVHEFFVYVEKANLERSQIRRKKVCTHGFFKECAFINEGNQSCSL